MGIEEDSLRELKLLNQNINTLARSMGRMSTESQSFGQTRSGQDDSPRRTPPRRNSKEWNQLDKSLSGYDAAAKKFMKASGNLTSETVEASEDLKTLRQSWGQNAEAMFDMKERIDRWGNSQTAMNAQTTKIVAGMSRFTSNLAKTTKMQSMLYSEQLTFIDGFKTFEKAAYFDELAKSLSSLSKTTKERMRLIDESTGMLRADLDASDFKRVRSTIGELESSFKEVLSGTDFKSFGELLRNGTFNESAGDGRSGVDATDAVLGNDKATLNREAVVKIAAMLQARGMFEPKNDKLSVLDANGNIKGAAELNKIDFTRLAAQIATMERSFGRAAENLDRNVDQFSDRMTRFIKSIKNAEGRAAGLDQMKEMAANFLSSGAALNFAKDKIVNAYKEISEFNIAQIPASYTEVSRASMKMGLSFKDTVKLMDENKRILAIYGPEKFVSSMGAMTKTFQKYGYTMEQAASMVGPTVESAIQSGVNVRDPAELNKYTDTMMSQFQKVSGMVKISAAEFAQLNKTLYQSEGTFETMLGMDVQRRQAFAQELVQLRTRYVTQGLELRQAQELVQAQQQQQRGRLKDRNEDGAKLLQAAQLAGLGSDQAMEAYRLATKGRRSAEEQARFSELTGQINQGLEQRIDQGYGAGGNGAMGDILNDLRQDLQTSSAVGQIGKAGSQMQIAKEAGAQVTPEEQKRAAAAAKGNESVAELGQAVNQVSSVLSNAFLGGLVGSSVALVAFGLQLSRLSLLMGGKGLLSTLADLGKGALSKGRGAVGGIANAASSAGGAIRGAAGAAGSAIGGAASTAGNAARSAAGTAGAFLGRNAGMLGKAAGAVGAVVAAGMAFSEYKDIEEKRKQGEITDKEATVKKAGTVVGAAGGIGAGLVGAAIGQVLIPIPGVGAVVGGAVGAALGGWLGKTGAEAVADAVVSDKKPEAKPKEPAKEVKPQVPPTKMPEVPKVPPMPEIPKVVVDGKKEAKPANDLTKALTDAIAIATPSLATAIGESIKNAFATAGVLQAKPLTVPTATDVIKPQQMSTMFDPVNALSSNLNILNGKLEPRAFGKMDVAQVNQPIKPMATPAPISGLPIAPVAPRVGLDSAKDSPAGGINTVAQDGQAVLDVQDGAVLEQLQSIAANMVQAVNFLARLSEQQPGAVNPNTMSTTSVPQMNQIPSAYQYTTGRSV